MFTGIIEETGKITAIRRGGGSCQIQIQADEVVKDTKVGDSIAVNGICLTVTSLTDKGFTADVMPETLNRSSLGSLKPGSSIVNMERAMQLGGRFGGHIVSGHIDGIGKITQIREDGNAVWYEISASSDILRYIIEKGSITIDGISLTVAKVDGRGFSVSVIPHTRAVTALSQKRVGDIVNLENDCIGKYVEKLMGGSLNKSDMNKVMQPEKQNTSQKETNSGAGMQGQNCESGITRDFLGKYGF